MADWQAEREKTLAAGGSRYRTLIRVVWAEGDIAGTHSLKSD